MQKKGCLKEGSKFSLEYTLRTKVLLKNKKKTGDKTCLQNYCKNKQLERECPHSPLSLNPAKNAQLEADE